MQPLIFKTQEKRQEKSCRTEIIFKITMRQLSLFLSL